MATPLLNPFGFYFPILHWPVLTHFFAFLLAGFPPTCLCLAETHINNPRSVTSVNFNSSRETSSQVFKEVFVERGFHV